ncbi:hypothetical protein SLA2020_529170 [Shorea laevis]
MSTFGGCNNGVQAWYNGVNNCGIGFESQNFGKVLDLTTLVVECGQAAQARPTFAPQESTVLLLAALSM